MDLGEIQAYAYFFFTAFLVAVLYGYIFHLYRSEKKGTRDYEKYGKMALDDEISSKPVEKRAELEDSPNQIKGE
jgi:cytochrome c oxidase cbb3-type subunit 4